MLLISISNFFSFRLLRLNSTQNYLHSWFSETGMDLNVRSLNEKHQSSKVNKLNFKKSHSSGDYILSVRFLELIKHSTWAAKETRTLDAQPMLGWLLVWHQNQYLNKGQAVHYYCHKELGMQTIIATLRSALSETAKKIELRPTQGNTYSWLLYKLHIIVRLSQPQRTCFIQHQ